MTSVTKSVVNRLLGRTGAAEPTAANPRLRRTGNLFEPLEARKLLTDIEVAGLDPALFHAAVDYANAEPGADVITFSPGVAGTIPLTEELFLTDSLTIRGGGVITLDGHDDMGILTLPAGITATLDGLTMTRADGESIRCLGTLTLTDCTITGANGLIGGGALYVRPGGVATVTNCTFSGNRADYFADGYGMGGAIRNMGSLTVTGSTISNNYALRNGGAIYNDPGATLSVADSTISNNTAGTGGGGIYNTDQGAATLERCLISGNSISAGLAGGIQNMSSSPFSLTVINSTITANAGEVTGGVYGPGLIANSTVAYNTGGASGGLAITINNGLVLISTIVAHNTGGDIGGSGLDVDNSFNNLIGDASSAGGLFTGDGRNNITGVDPMFVYSTPQNWGGRTAVLPLQDFSPAVGAGAPYGGVTTDQRGNPFVRDGACDIGAYEHQATGFSLTVDTLVDENDGNYLAGDLSLREAISLAQYSAPSDTIGFASSLNGGAITLSQGTLEFHHEVVINGPGADLLAINANGQSRILWAVGATVSVSGLRLTGGSSAGEGAGIYTANSTLTLTNVALTSNTADGAGGGLMMIGGTLDMSGSTISGNTASVAGGGIYLQDVAATITNSTISGNTNFQSGGIAAMGGSLSIRNSTIASNTTQQEGGGALFAYGALLTSTVVADNTGGNVAQELDAASSYNLIGDAVTTGGLVNGVNGNLVNVFPDLAPLADNGGPTQTHALKRRSAALGAGSNPAGLLVDQRGAGFHRVRFGNIDIGAFEAINPTVAGFTAADTSLTIGESTLLTATGVADPDGSIYSVEFYRDLDADGVPDANEFAGSDHSAAGGYTLEFSTEGLAPGILTVLAVAIDNHDLMGIRSLAFTLAPASAQTYTVTVAADEDDGDRGPDDLSLREAVLLSNATTGARDTITFSAALNGQVLTLDANEIDITDGVTIQGPGAAQLTVSGASVTRIFAILQPVEVAISGLRLMNGYAGDGAAVYNTGTLTLTTVHVTGSHADGDGGAVANYGTLTIVDSRLWDNSAVYGGAVYSGGGTTLTIRGTLIETNTARTGGGVSIYSDCTASIDRTLIRANAATDGGGGGAAVTQGGTLTLRNTTVHGNSAVTALGGGLFNDRSTLIVLNSTIVGNSQTDSFGGGIAINEGVSTIVISTIVAGNTGAGSDIYGTLSSPSDHNLIQSASDAGGLTNGVDGNIIGVDPRLAALADNGGPTQSMALQPGSPAIGKGRNPHNLPYDQRGSGFARVNAGAIDIGAVESTFTAAGNDLLGASSGASGNLNITGRSATDEPLIFQQAAGATTWTRSDLQAKTNSPAITGEIVTWVDPKDGRNYAAALTAEGLGLFTNTSGASWTFRNLNTEVPSLASITGNLTVFTSTDNKISIAGVAASGDLLRFFQTGAGPSGSYAWSGVNHGDELRAQGLTMPQYAGRITSFVTPWNALNIIGLDASGQIQAVWWHQSMNTGGKWITNNLSQEYGAPALTGGLTVWQTSWNAINIGGTDLSGKLSATWWVAGQNNNAWLTNNLTDDIGGPILEASSMCSWVTPWGAMNIAGRESDGSISVYWWVPGVNNNLWNIENFREELPSATPTVGPVTGITATAGAFSMSILSTTSSGDVVRLWWTPATNVWAEQNLTQTATNV